MPGALQNPPETAMKFQNWKSKKWIPLDGGGEVHPGFGAVQLGFGVHLGFGAVQTRIWSCAPRVWSDCKICTSSWTIFSSVVSEENKKGASLCHVKLNPLYVRIKKYNLFIKLICCSSTTQVTSFFP